MSDARKVGGVATGLFNAGLTGKAWRAIDLHEGEQIDPEAFRALIRAAAVFDASSIEAKS